MATSQSPRGVPSKDAQIEGYVCIQSHILLSLTCLDSQFQFSNHQLLQDSIQDRLNVEHASPSLSSNGNTNNNTTPKSTFNCNHRNDFNSITDAITPTQISSRQAAGSNSTPRARLNLDCSVGQFDHAATTASARYEQALRFHHDECESSGIMQEGTNWRNVWASLRNGEISIWSDRSSSISSPESPLCLIPLSTFNHSSTDPPNSKAASWEITLFSNPPTSLRSASYGSTNQRSLGHQAQTISSSQSPPLDQGSSSTTFPWTRSISKGSLMKSTSSRTLADALRFGTSSSSTDASIPDQNKRELNHSNSQSTLNADVKENRKERGGSAWAKILRSRRLKSFMPTSQSSDSLSDQLSINGSVASSSRHGGEGMGSEDGNARDRGTSISSSPLSRSIALPSPGFSSSSHSTTATSINQSPTTSSCPKTRQPPSKIILQLSSASSMSQWNEAIKCHSKTSFQSERSQTSPTNASSSRKRPPLASIPGFSSPPSGETRDAYIQSSTSRSNLQQPLSPTILPRNQASNSGRFGTLPSSQSESILVMQATSESKLSQRRKERADAARNQEPSQSQTSWNDPFPSKQPEEGINVSIKSQSRHPKKQSSVPVVSSGPLTSLKSSSSRTGLSALLTGRKRGREDQKKQPSQEQVDTALHRQVQNCRASIEITPGNSRGKGEFYRPSTSSGASLKSFGSNSSPANEAADHQRGKAAKKRDARPTSAAGYEHVQARNSFTLTSGLTHAQNLAKQYLAGQRETPPSPVLSNASCMTTATGASVSEVSSEYVPPGMPFLKELANRRTSSPLAKEAMLPELTSLTIPSRDGQGRMRGASPQFRSSSPLSNQSTFTSPNSITQSLYTPSEGGESALDRFARVREGSFSQGPHGLGLEGVDQGSNGNGERFTFKSQRSWSKSPSFAPSSEITSTSPNPQSTLRQVTLKRLRGTPSRGSMESSREEDLEESDLPDRRSSLNGSALGISFSPSLNLPFKSSSPSLSGTSNALGLSRSPSLRGLANKLLLRPSSASGISSPLQFSSSRNSTSEPRESRDSESSYYDGRASSGDTSNSGRSLEFDNEIDIDDYEMIPSPSLPIINLHPSATPTRLTTELVGSTNEKASLGRKTRKTAERWANRLGSSPRMNSSTNKTIADVQDNYNSLSVSEANHQRRKQSSSSSSTSSSPPIIERILPPEQIISILDNLRDGSGRSLDSKDAAAAREAMLRSSSENHQSQFPQRRSPKPAPRSNRRPRTSNTSPTKRSHRDVVHDQRTTSPALTTRRTLGSIQSSMSEQSGLSLPPPPRMSKRPSGTSLAATLENAEEGNQTTSFSTPHTKNKKLSRSASEAAISTESSGSTPIQDLNSAFPSPIRRSRRQQSSNDKENDIGRKRSNSTLSCQSSEDLHCSSQEVLLESEDKEVESFSSRLLLSGESCDNWTTFGNHHKTLTASQTSNTFVNVKSSNGHSNCHGDESFATVTASNSSSSTLEGSQEAVLFHVTGKKVISQI